MTDYITDYIVETHPHGIVIRGHIPISDAEGLFKVWGAAGMDQIHPGIAASLGASFVIGRADHLEQWRAEIEAKLAALTDLPPLTRWLRGCGTGISSLTIVNAITGQHIRHPDIPHDSEDLGRCIRLLDAVPELRPNLSKVAAKYPEWGPIVAAWDELEALYREEAQTGLCPKTYARLAELQ